VSGASAPGTAQDEFVQSLRGEDVAVQLGLVGLGKMGGNMAERVRRAGHEVVGYDKFSEKRDVESLEALVEALDAPRVVWVMVPSGEPTRSTVRELAEVLQPGDVVVEGGNSRYTDDAVHAEILGAKGIGYLDCGVSGGVWGLENGYALMVGGDAADVAKVQPIFDALRPPSPTDESGQELPGVGYVHAGRVGAGHFSKMVHNGIEYAMMQAYGEGYELLEAVDLVDDVPGVIASWTQGTVIRSWLLDLLVRALQEDPKLERIKGYAEDSGEGRWTVEQAIEHAVPMPAIAGALFARFASRQEESPTMKAVAALRNQFGGHAVRAVAAQEAERPA
jgi:6-phosphogluconate dehydrogenase